MAKFFKIPFAATGDILAVPDATQPDGSVSYSQGFGPDYQRKTDGTDPLAKTVPRNSTNALFNDLTGAVGEIQLNGVPAWQLVGAPYPINAIVRYNNKNWTSLVANNSATPAEGASWSEVAQTSYTKAQVDTKLATKANTATTIAGYGITDAYTKAQVDASLSGKANVSTTIAGYGITDAYTKTQTDSLLASKANKATTLSGYGITDAYTKAQVDSALSGKAGVATTLSGYGITDAYTKTETDTRYAQRVSNLSDLASIPTARTNLGLGTAATANLTTSTTDSTVGRALKNGDWGFGSAATAPSLADFKTLSPGGIYRGVFNTTANGPFSSSDGFTAIATNYVGTVVIWIVNAANRSFIGYYNSSNGNITWAEQYGKGNTSAAIQAFLAASDNASARTSLGVAASVDKQMCNAWVNFNGTGTPAIRDSYNVTSITDEGVGLYAIIFTQALSNSNYSAVGSTSLTGNATTVSLRNQETTGFKIRTAYVNEANPGAPFDPSIVNITVSGGK